MKLLLIILYAVLTLKCNILVGMEKSTRKSKSEMVTAQIQEQVINQCGKHKDIITATKELCYPCVHALLAQGINPNTQSRRHGWGFLLSPLNEAAQRAGRYTLTHNRIVALQIGKLLLDNYANPDIQDELKHTPLHTAAYAESDAFIKLLLIRGANPNIKDNTGDVPLGCYNVLQKPKLVELFLQKDANPNVVNNFGNTLLHKAIELRNLDSITLLIKYGANINAPSGDNGAIPLHDAVYRKDLELFEFLLRHGADIHALNKRNQSILHIALFCKNEPTLIKLVLENWKINVNQQDSDGNTPLHDCMYGAMQSGITYRLDFLKQLLERGADPNIKNNFGRTPLHYAQNNNLEEAVQLLIEYGADPTIQDPF